MKKFTYTRPPNLKHSLPLKPDTHDFHAFTYKNMSVAKRRAFDVGDVWRNRAQCLECKDIIESVNRHDFVRCKCGKIAVDGGSWYRRRIGSLELCQEMSETFTYLPKES